MIEIEKPRLDFEVLSDDGSYGKFTVAPLERGFGTTLGLNPNPQVTSNP